jgi:ATP-dependent protease ClpP protease subunit
MRNYNQNEVYSQQILNPLTYGVVSRPIAYTHDIFIDKELVQPLDWRLELDTIRNASPNDIVNLRINCPGGSDMVMGAFVKAIAECQGHVVGHIEHTCASAATIIFLACHEFIVSDDAEFMVHTSSLGYGGKQNNFNEYAIFVNKSNERLMRKYYEGFLSQEEIDLTLKGADLWMNSEEVIERLQNKIEKETEDEPEPLTREVAENLSKEELINMMFGEEEESTTEVIATKEDFGNGDNDDDDNLTHIYSWADTVVLWEENDTQEYLFEVDNIEYDINDDFTPAYFVVDSGFSTEEFRSLCNDIGIQYSLSNTREQLSSKIIKEIKSKITK